MNKIESLINKLCPNGVEFRNLGEILDYEQPTKYIVKTADYNDEFSTPVLTAGQSFILGYTDEKSGIYTANKNNACIIFDDFTTSFHWVDFDFKVKSSALKILKPFISCENAINFKFVFYAMKCILFNPAEHSRHWISKYSKIKIPIPPLEIQNEIVRILDSFTQLQAELQAELQARKKQYAYYRNKLLSIKELQKRSNDVKMMNLGEICEYPKERISINELDENNFVSVENLLQNGAGKTLSNSVPKYGQSIKYINDDILIGNIRPYLKKIWLADRIGGTNGDVVLLRIKDKYNNALQARFLYHCLADVNFSNFHIKNSKGAKMPRGDKNKILNFKIPIPPLEIQYEIVRILDSFDKLVNDLTSGIPAEITARKKQYEYYREKLLNFKEKTSEL